MAHREGAAVEAVLIEEVAEVDSIEEVAEVALEAAAEDRVTSAARRVISRGSARRVAPTNVSTASKRGTCRGIARSRGAVVVVEVDAVATGVVAAVAEEAVPAADL